MNSPPKPAKEINSIVLGMGVNQVKIIERTIVNKAKKVMNGLRSFIPFNPIVPKRKLKQIKTNRDFSCPREVYPLVQNPNGVAFIPDIHAIIAWPNSWIQTLKKINIKKINELAKIKDKNATTGKARW